VSNPPTKFPINILSTIKEKYNPFRYRKEKYNNHKIHKWSYPDKLAFHNPCIKHNKISKHKNREFSQFPKIESTE
jgi:hypothetical protein